MNSVTIANNNNSQLTSSSLINANNILFNFEKTSPTSTIKQQKPKPKSEYVPPPKVLICKCCSKKGHKIKDCPTPDINKICSNCNKLGHVSVNCKVILVNFARPKQPQQERKPKIDKQNSNNNNNQKVLSPPISPSISPSSISPPLQQPTTTTTTSISTTALTSTIIQQQQQQQQKPKLSKIEIESLKLSKELPTRQFILSDGLQINESQINNIINSNITTISIPLTKSNNTNDLIPTIQLLHKNDINVTFRIPVTSFTTCCLNNIEIQNNLKSKIQSLIDQLKETNEKLDGLFFTDLNNHHSLCCQLCKDNMLSNGLNPNNQKDIITYIDYTIDNFKRLIIQFIISITTVPIVSTIPTTATTTNSHSKKKKTIPISISFENFKSNSPTSSIKYFERDSFTSSNYQEIEYVDQNSFSLFSHYTRNLSNQSIGKINLFDSNNSPFLKSFDTLSFQLLYSSILNNGKYSLQLNTNSNNYNNNLFKFISKVNEFIGSKENYFKNSKLVYEIAILCPSFEIGDNNNNNELKLNSLYGAIQLLESNNYQFNIINQIESIVIDELSRYKLIILPDYCTLTREQSLKLQKYTNLGGSLLMSNLSGMDLISTSINQIGDEINGNQQSYNRLELNINSILDKSKYLKNKSSNNNNNNKLSMVDLFNKIDFEYLSNCLMIKNTDDIQIDKNQQQDENSITLMNDTAGSGGSGNPLIIFNPNQRLIYFSNPIFQQYNTINQTSLHISSIFTTLLDNILLPVSDKLVNIDPSPINVKVFLCTQNDKYIVHFLNYKQIPTTTTNNNESYHPGDDTKISISIKLPNSNSIQSLNLVKSNNISIPISNFKISNSHLIIPEIQLNSTHQILVLQF